MNKINVGDSKTYGIKQEINNIIFQYYLPPHINTSYCFVFSPRAFSANKPETFKKTIVERRAKKHQNQTMGLNNLIRFHLAGFSDGNLSSYSH